MADVFQKTKLSIFLLVITTWFGCTDISEEVRLANHVVAKRLTTSKDSIIIHSIFNNLLEETKWKQKFQINRRYNPSLVNVFVIDGSKTFTSTDDNLSGIVGNCSYVGSNIIIIDDHFLRTFLEHHHVTSNPYSNFLEDDQLCLAYWIIGHELGHLVSGHNVGHFGASSLDSLAQNSSIMNRQELEADSFFVSSIIANEKLLTSVKRLMINILNAEIQVKVGSVQAYGAGLIFDYTNQQIVDYADQPTHPEYVIRLSRMLELSSKMSDDAALKSLVGDFIKRLKKSSI